MKEIENALPPLVFEEIQNYILGHDIPWYYYEDVTYPKELTFNEGNSDKKILEQTKKIIAQGVDEELANYNYFLSHMVYFDCRIYSPKVFDVLQPLVSLLNPRALIRIKINNYPQTPKIIHHQDHVDGNYEHKGALFYVNTNNGMTVFEKKTEVASVENKLVLFNSSKLHRSTTSSDTNRRITIAINYF